jgi:host factor-I protein
VHGRIAAIARRRLQWNPDAAASRAEGSVAIGPSCSFLLPALLLKPPADPKSRQFLQLNRFRRERTTVHVYLLSGTRFTGRIRSFDVHTMLLETQHGEMVIYGHAVSTVEPAVGVRGRRPGGPPRRDDAGWRRDADGGPPSDRREAPRRAPPPESGDPDVQLPAPPESRPAAPTVTIVRRRSRLVPRPDGSG